MYKLSATNRREAKVKKTGNEFNKFGFYAHVAGIVGIKIPIVLSYPAVKWQDLIRSSPNGFCF